MTEATASSPAPGDNPEPAADWSGLDAPAPELAPTAVESLVNALLDAGPEVAEHVVRSAQELLLAAQTVVDAAQRAVAEQQALRRPADRPTERAAGPATDTQTGAGAADADAESTATVHHLDVGE